MTGLVCSSCLVVYLRDEADHTSFVYLVDWQIPTGLMQGGRLTA